MALASCSFDPATGVTQAGQMAVTCPGMTNLSADRCGRIGDAALANMGDVDGQAATVEIDISALDGECQRAAATVVDRAGRAFASVSLACPTH